VQAADADDVHGCPMSRERSAASNVSTTAVCARPARGPPPMT
jgi:hypothetical protein